MQYTVKDVLSIPYFATAKLRSGENIISSQLVDSVTVMEIPVEDFVRKNELVLTTAIGCGNNTDLFLSYVKDIYLSGAAALGIAIGRHVDCIPQEILDFCEKQNFPLIELPWEVRFSDVIKYILEQLNKWEKSTMVKADSLQRELLRLYLDNRPLEDVLAYLSKEFQMDTELQYNSDIIKFINNNSNQNTIPNLNEIENHTIIRHQNGHFSQIIPVMIVSHEPCYLILNTKRFNSSPIPKSVINQVVGILTLWIQKDIAIINNKKKETEEFIKCLLKGNWGDKEEFIKTGKKLGYSIQLPYVCIVGQPEKLEEFYQHKKEIKQDIEKDFRRTFSELVESTAQNIKKQIIYTFHRELVVIYLECTGDYVGEEVNEFLDAIDVLVEKKRIPTCSWGIGENHAGRFTFHLSYKNARTALEIGRSHRGPGVRSTFASTGIYQLLISLSNNQFSTELMHSTIGAVAAYDKNNGLDLLQTLATYLHHQGNVSQTARTLSLHRQSLLYRLRKIESLTNRSLNEPDDIFLLQFCLKLWTVRFEHIA